VREHADIDAKLVMASEWPLKDDDDLQHPQTLAGKMPTSTNDLGSIWAARDRISADEVSGKRVLTLLGQLSSSDPRKSEHWEKSWSTNKIAVITICRDGKECLVYRGVLLDSGGLARMRSSVKDPSDRLQQFSSGPS